MSKILVTGAAGFIGSHLVKKLHASGESVISLDLLGEQVHGNDPEKTSATFKTIRGLGEFHRGDVRDRDLLLKLLDGCSTVVHLAAETGTGQSMYDMARYCDVNVTGTAVLMEAVAKTKSVRKVLVASSRAIYGEGKYLCSQHGVQYPNTRLEAHMSQGLFEPACAVCGEALSAAPTSEDSPMKPLSIYGITKAAQEEIMITAARSLGIGAVALRLQNVYGPGQSLSNPYTGILSIFSTRARANKSIAIFEDGLESRDFVFVEDVIEAFQLAIKSPFEGQAAFNVGFGISTSVNEVVAEITKFFKSKSDVSITGQFRSGDIRHNFADLHRIKTTFGFKPRVSFGEGLGRFLTWAEAQTTASDSYEKSLDELRERGLLK
jgi:dTDP-L-rhamnose 4-epimerase